MKQETPTLAIELLDKTWQVRCPEDQVTDLKKCAQLLNNKMLEIVTGGKATMSERLAVMAAINTIYDLYKELQQKDLYIESLGSRIRELQNQSSKVST